MTTRKIMAKKKDTKVSTTNVDGVDKVKTPKLTKEQRKAALDALLVQTLADYKQEAKNSKITREKLNDKNSDIFYGRYKFKKKKGQSRIFLHKIALIVESLTASLQETVEKIDIAPIGGYEDEIFTPELVKGVFRTYTKKANFEQVGMDALQTMMLEGTAYLRVGGKKEKERDGTDYWCLKIWPVAFTDMYKDPNGNLYAMNSMMIDKHDLVRMAKNPKSGYDLEAIQSLTFGTDENKDKKDRNANNDLKQPAKRRKQIRLEECWCTVLDEDGNVALDIDDKPMENVVFTVANGLKVVRGPMKNPKWHNEHPYIEGQALRGPGSVFPRAPMDPTSDLSISQSELFNLMMDGGLASVFGTRQVHPDFLADRRQIADGLPAQATLVLKDDVPTGAKAVEQLTTGEAPSEILPFYNILDGLISEMGLLNESQMGGFAPRKPLATELVQAGTAIAKVLEKVAKNIVKTMIEPLALKCWSEMLQNIDYLPEDEFTQILSVDASDQDRARANVQAFNALSKKERYERGMKGFKFEGVSSLDSIRKLRDLQKYQTFMQSALSTPDMQAEFKKLFSIPRLDEQIAEALSIDIEKIKLTPQEVQFQQELAKIRENALMQNEMAGNQNAAAGNAGSQTAPGVDPGTQPGSGEAV